MVKRGPPLLEVRGLKAGVGGKEILKGLDLAVRAGEIHLVMGPNGSGKSTLALALMGHPKYSVTGGRILFKAKDIGGLETAERARLGMFLALQHPTEIPGVTLSGFLRAAVNSGRKEPIPLAQFREACSSAARQLGIDHSFLERGLNEGFSGGEKKRAEIFQMKLLKPRLAILDETDSGLDLDSLKVVATAIEKMRSPERSPEFAAIVITHNPRVLKYIRPDRIHVLAGGRIVRSGGREIAKRLEKEGYSWLRR